MKYFLLILSLSIFLIPQFTLGGFPLRLEDFLIVLFVIFYIDRSKFSSSFKRITLLFILFIISNITSLILEVFNGYAYSYQDINTILLYIKSALFLCAGYLLGQRLKFKDKNFILFCFSIGLVFSSLVAIIQYFNFGGYGQELYLLYGREERIVYGISRVIGVLGNPNYASYFHSVGFLLILSINAPSKISKLVRVTALVICFLGVSLTFSRTGLFALLIVWMLYYLQNKEYKKLLYLLLSGAIILVVFLEQLVKGTRFSKILAGEGGGNVGDFGNRSNLIWERRFQSFFDNPIFGIGPSKNRVSETVFSITIFDNTYLLLLITSGMIGLFLYLLTLWKVFNIKDLKENVLSDYRKLVLPIMVLTLLFFITSDLIWNITFVSYFYLYIGVIVSYFSFKLNYASTN